MRTASGAPLERDCILVYRLQRAPNDIVFWYARADRHGLQRHAGEPPRPGDAEIRGGYWDMIETVQRSREVLAPDKTFETRGDPSAIAP